MMAKKFAQPPMRRTVFAAALARLVSQPSFDRLVGMLHQQRFTDRKAAQTRDPVSPRGIAAPISGHNGHRR